MPISADFRLLESLQGKVNSPSDYEAQSRKSRLLDLAAQQKQNEVNAQPKLLEQQIQGNDLNIQATKMNQAVKQLDVISNVSGYLRDLPDDNAVNTQYQQFKSQYGSSFPNLPDTMTKADADTAYQSSLSAKDRLTADLERMKLSQPASQAGKIQSDVNAGYITPEQGDTAIKGLDKGTKVTVNNNPELAGNVAFSKAANEKRAGRFDDVITRGNASSANLERLKTMRELARNTKTGALEPAKVFVSAMAESLGVNPNTLGLDKAANAQALIGVTKDLVLQKQLEQKGPQVEADARRIEESLAGISKVELANELLANVNINNTRRSIEQAEFYLKYEAEKKPEQAEADWFKYAANTPTVSSKKDANGMPVLLYDFVDKFLQRNPEATKEDALNFWREKYADLPQKKSPVNLQSNKNPQSVNSVTQAALSIYGDTPQAQLAAAQAIHESGLLSGKPSQLALQGNNYFGVKGTGTAGSITMPTTEVVNGRPVKVMAKFAAYNSPEESFMAHKQLLERRYKHVLNAETFDDGAVGLQRGGYATDPHYARKLKTVRNRVFAGT